MLQRAVSRQAFASGHKQKNLEGNNVGRGAESYKHSCGPHGEGAGGMCHPCPSHHHLAASQHPEPADSQSISTLPGTHSPTEMSKMKAEWGHGYSL